MVTGVEAPRYAAFISYSHKDGAAARSLHGRLERYRIPKRLVGTPGEHGPVPARLTPIFRDRDELPAAGDLSEKVRGALAASDALVVVCSPHSAASPWVAREIAAFRELNPGRPVLAAVIAGEPGECFPEGLGGADANGARIEPLAADLRKAGDGQRLGFLKLVAGLTGIGLDALVQRDAARAIRRVTAVTLTALAATLVMAVLTVIALNARQEADRQRAEAEGLVEFMLTDLRTKLKGVGRLDVMDAVNRRAIFYYRDIGRLSRLPDESLERRARVLHAMGEDQKARGEFGAALASFQEAHRITEALLARDPRNPQRIFAHAQSEYWIGSVHQQSGQWPEAKARYARYAAAAEQLIGIAPRNASYMMERGWGAQNLGIVQLRGYDDAAGAERLFSEAIDWLGKADIVRPADPEILGALSQAYAWLADSFYAQERWRDSLAARRRQYGFDTALLRSDPANSRRIYMVIGAERAVARLESKVGKWGEALALLIVAHRRAELLHARDPDNADWLLLKTKVECDLLNLPATAIPANTAELRAHVRQAATALERQRNPRISELTPCLRVIERGTRNPQNQEKRS